MSKSNDSGWLPTMVVATLLLVLPPVSYLGAYYALADRSQFLLNLNTMTARPRYRIESPWVETIFEPAYQFDRWLHPTEWEPLVYPIETAPHGNMGPPEED